MTQARLTVKDDSIVKIRNLSSDRMGIGLFLDTKVDVGSDIEILLDRKGVPYVLNGQVRWRAGVDKMPDGKLAKTEFKYGTDEIVTHSFYFTSLEDCFGKSADGFDYTIGIRLDSPIPHEFFEDIPKDAVKY